MFPFWVCPWGNGAIDSCYCFVVAGYNRSMKLGCAPTSYAPPIKIAIVSWLPLAFIISIGHTRHFPVVIKIYVITQSAVRCQISFISWSLTDLSQIDLLSPYFLTNSFDVIGFYLRDLGGRTAVDVKSPCLLVVHILKNYEAQWVTITFAFTDLHGYTSVSVNSSPRYWWVSSSSSWPEPCGTLCTPGIMVPASRAQFFRPDWAHHRRPNLVWNNLVVLRVPTCADVHYVLKFGTAGARRTWVHTNLGTCHGKNGNVFINSSKPSGGQHAAAERGETFANGNKNGDDMGTKVETVRVADKKLQVHPSYSARWARRRAAYEEEKWGPKNLETFGAASRAWAWVGCSFRKTWWFQSVAQQWHAQAPLSKDCVPGYCGHWKRYSTTRELFQQLARVIINPGTQQAL